MVLGGEPVELSPDDVVLRVRGQQGFAVSREGGEVVALDLNLDEGLRKRGLSRDVVRLVQDLRKASGLEVSGPHPCCTWWGSTPSPSSSTSSPARCWRSRSCPGPGEGEGVVLDLDDELLAEPVRVWIERVDPD